MKKKSDYRGEPMENGVLRVLWDKVDPLLRYSVRQSGDLGRLAQETGVNARTLSERRRKLGFPPLPTGRPRVTSLTSLQEEVVSSLASGEKVGEVAAARGVSSQAISNIKKDAANKLKTQCPGCRGTGVVPSDGCCGDEPHHHVCLQCGAGVPTKHREMNHG